MQETCCQFRKYYCIADSIVSFEGQHTIFNAIPEVIFENVPCGYFMSEVGVESVISFPVPCLSLLF